LSLLQIGNPNSTADVLALTRSPLALRQMQHKPPKLFGDIVAKPRLRAGHFDECDRSR
jgi:hypothetical protein